MRTTIDRERAVDARPRSGSTAIYVRLSKDDEDSHSIKTQLADCRALVKRNGWGPATEFIDNDLSAFSGKRRPAFEAMMTTGKAGELERIVLPHLDRFTRQPRQLEDLIDMAEQRGVQVISVYGGDLHLENDDGITMARVAVTMANKASRDTGRRVSKMKKTLRDEGQSGGGPRPFGWRRAPLLDASGAQLIRKDGRPRTALAHDPKEALLIDEAAGWLLSGVSLSDVARRWNAAGVPRPQTHRADWMADSVRQTMELPRHAGLLAHRPQERTADGRRVWGKPQIIGPGNWKPIIDRARWEQLQTVLNNRGAAGRVPRRRSLLTGLVSCARCGSTMVRTGARGRNKDGAVRKTWRCARTSANSKACGGVSIGATELETLLVNATMIRADESSLATVVQQQGQQGHEAAAVVKQLETLERRLDAASQSYSAGKLPLRAFERVTAGIDKERHDLEGRLGRLTKTAVLEPFTGKPGLLRAAWDGLTVDQQRQIIGAFLGKVEVRPATKGARRRFDMLRVRVQAHNAGKA